MAACWFEPRQQAWLSSRRRDRIRTTSYSLEAVLINAEAVLELRLVYHAAANVSP
jgi:hypothetical protein